MMISLSHVYNHLFNVRVEVIKFMYLIFVIVVASKSCVVQKNHEIMK